MSLNAAISIMLQHVTNGANPEMLEVSLGPLRTSTSVPYPQPPPFYLLLSFLCVMSTEHMVYYFAIKLS